MSLRDEFRVVRDVNRLSREAEAAKGTPAFSLDNVIVLLVVLTPALVVWGVFSSALGPSADRWMQRALTIIVISPLFLGAEFRVAYCARRTHRLGPASELRSSRGRATRGGPWS